MASEFSFITLDANQPIEAQQSILREIISERLHLADFSAEPTHPKRFAAAR